MPQNSAPDHTICKCHYDYFVLLLASRLKNGLHDTNIVSTKVKEVRSELDLHKKSFDGFDMVMSILKLLVPRLGSNAMSYDPATLILTLKVSHLGSFKAFHLKAKEAEDILGCLKEDYGPHKLLLRCLNELNNIMNYRTAMSSRLIPLRRHIRVHGDTSSHIFEHGGVPLTIDMVRSDIIEHRLNDSFIFDRNSTLLCQEATACASSASPSTSTNACSKASVHDSRLLSPSYHPSDIDRPNNVVPATHR